MNEVDWQPAIVVSKAELDLHGVKAAERFGSAVVWDDIEERHQTLAGRKILVRPSPYTCQVCDAPYYQVETESARAALPTWIQKEGTGAGICSTQVMTD